MGLTKQELMTAVQFIQRADADDLAIMTQTFVVTGRGNPGVQASAPAARTGTGRGRPAGSGRKAANANGNAEANGANAADTNRAPNADADNHGIVTEYQVGQEVLYAKKRGGEQRATVTKLTGKAVHIKTDTGEDRRVAPEQLRPMAASAGEMATAQGQNAGQDLVAA